MADFGNTESISTAFVDARRAGHVLPDFPGAYPLSMDEAYHIQDNAIALTAREVGGWKVGRVAAELVDAYGAVRIGGPIFSDQIVCAADGEIVAMPVLPGFAAVEAEILLKIGEVPDGELTLANAPAYISEVRLGIEIASSPFPGINQHGPAVTASDFGNNFGLVVGPAIANWQDVDLLNTTARLEIDGLTQGEGVMADMLDGPFGSLVFINSMLRRRNLSLNVGDWISTGAITGVHAITAGCSATASFADAYSVSCRTVPYQGAAA
jgi:2-keto-4-pentenoate hydratase